MLFDAAAKTAWGVSCAGCRKHNSNEVTDYAQIDDHGQLSVKGCIRRGFLRHGCMQMGAQDVEEDVKADLHQGAEEHIHPETLDAYRGTGTR